MSRLLTTKIGETTYVGANPVYAPIKHPTLDIVTGYVKVAKGIPWVSDKPSREERRFNRLVTEVINKARKGEAQ